MRYNTYSTSTDKISYMDLYLQKRTVTVKHEIFYCFFNKTRNNTPDTSLRTFQIDFSHIQKCASQNLDDEFSN